MWDKPIPTPKSFKNQLKQWTIQVLFDSLPYFQITFIITGKKQKQIQFQQSFDQNSIPSDIKQNVSNSLYDLYLFLQREHQKSIKVYDFKPELNTLRFYHRGVNKVFSLKMKKYINGVQQKTQQQKLAQMRRSNRYVLVSHNKPIQQRIIEKQFIKEPQLNKTSQDQLKQQTKSDNIKATVSTIVNQESKIIKQDEQEDEYDYFYDLQEQEQDDKLKFTQQKDIDYDQWLNQVEDNGSQIFVSKIPISKQQQVNCNPYYTQYKDNIVHSQIIYNQKLNNQKQNHQTKQTNQRQQKSQNRNIDIKFIIKQNIQLKQQKEQLIAKVAQLQIQNKFLKQRIQKYQFKNQSIQIKNDYSNYPQLNTSIQKPQSLWNTLQNTNPIKYSQPYSPLISPLSMTTNWPYNQQRMNSIKVADEWAQQYSNIKRRNIESIYNKYLDNNNKVFDISYKEYSLNQFEINLFPFDWSQVRILNCDGNLLRSQGLDMIIKNLGPYLRQISAGYNLIVDVDGLERCQNLRKIDLRANPLSQYAKSYLNRLKKQGKIQILY